MKWNKLFLKPFPVSYKNFLDPPSKNKDLHENVSPCFCGAFPGLMEPGSCIARQGLARLFLLGGFVVWSSYDMNVIL
jgi:hypothetical protein